MEVFAANFYVFTDFIQTVIQCQPHFQDKPGEDVAIKLSRSPELQNFFISPKTPYFGPGNRKKILLLIISYSCKYCVRFCSESKYIVFQGKANDKIVPVLPSTEVVRLQQGHSLLVFINLLSSWEMRETKNRVAHVSQVEHLMNTTGQVVFFLYVY